MKAIRSAGELDVFVNCHQLQRITPEGGGEATEEPVFLCGQFMKYIPGGSATDTVDADEDGAIQKDAFIAYKNDVTRILKTNDQLEWRDEGIVFDVVTKTPFGQGYYRITVERHSARQQ